MKTIAFSLAALAAASAATTLATSPAMAESATVVVDTSAYDLSSAEGYAAVSQRIDAAAETVCGSTIVRPITASLSAQRCQDVAFQDGLQQLDRLTRTPQVIIGASR